MTVDITALAAMVRRMDSSATMKSFVAVAAFLLVATHLGAIYRFVADMLAYDILDSEDTSFLIAWVIAAVAFSFTPLAFIFWDWMARRPWRHLAAITGALLGALGFALVGGGVGVVAAYALRDVDRDDVSANLIAAGLPLAGLLLLVLWMVVRSPLIRRLTGWAMIGFALLLVWASLNPFVNEALEQARFTEDLIEALVSIGAMAFLLWLIIRAVRHRIVLSGERPRELLLGSIQRRKFWPRMAFLAGLPSSLWHARAMLTAPFWAFLLARPLVYAGVVVLTGNATAAGRVALGLGLIAGGHVLFYLGKRLAARRIWNPDDPLDPRPPVLFLRSFEDDQLRFRRPWWDLIGRWVDLWSFRRNADEAMIDEVAQYGPVVALGMPGEQKIPFGAARYYSSHDDWQRIVTDTAKRAQAVIIGAGDTPGVRWEYELLAREKLLDRTLLVFPPAAGDRATGAAALAAFAEATGIDARFDLPADARPVALLTTDAGPTLLTAHAPGATACLVALRGHFQKVTAAHLADPLGL